MTELQFRFSGYFNFTRIFYAFKRLSVLI